MKRRSAPETRSIERLERRLMMAANPIISEFMAKNATTLQDGNKQYSDWIEVQNTGDAAINLVGWHLSDDPTTPDKWTFPSVNLTSGGFLVIFADGTGIVDPAGYLHTNFSLSTDGEQLSLNRPDLSVASRWNADGSSFPPQVTDISYGTGSIYTNTTLLNTSAPASAFVPHDSSLDPGQWTATNYNSSSWTSGTTGVGYDTGGYEDNSVAPNLIGDWNADDLKATIANGGSVLSWTDEVKHAAATASASNTAPTLVTSDFNTHAGIHFNATNSTQLRVAAGSNPMAGADNFSVAVVFKTTTGIASRGLWYNNAGLVDGEETGSTNDWGMAVSSSGYVGAGMGNPDTTVYGASTINSGTTHIAVFSRSGGSYTLYVDGGNGVKGSCSAADRDVAAMVFGSLQTNLNYFTGDIAEVQIFDGAQTTPTRAFDAAKPLATKYAVTLTAATSTGAPTLTGDWIGDSVASLGNNAAVATWTSTANSKTINASAGSLTVEPIVSTNQLNGHAVVHFNGSANNQMRVASGVNPMSAAGDFTIAVVFRTSNAGVGTASDWFSNTGIVDAEQGGIVNDWGVGINSSGQIGAGIGNPDTTIYSGGLLNDGHAHVMIYTRSGEQTELYVDGQTSPIDGTASIAARATADMVFGSIQTGSNYFTGDLAEVQVYGGALTDDLAGSVAHTLAGKYGVTLAPSVYAPLIGLNLQSAMSGTATTADIRIPFTIAGSTSAYTRVLLKMQYDDGFVAYLNGTEVARRNAPTGPITYTSVALAIQPKSAALMPETIDLSAYLSLLIGNGATNVLAIKALNTSASDPDLFISPVLIASTSVVGPAYFATPTPGAANSTDGYAGLVQAPSISVAHGYYSSAFTTTVLDTTPGATIYYTTDGSEPSPTNGIAFTPASGSSNASGVVTISASTPLRAAAFLNTYVPSAITTVTYLFVSSALSQTNTAPVGAYWSTAVDQSIVNLNQTYSVAQALTAIPSVSLVLPFGDIFGQYGIYANPTARGHDWEKATSVEYFDPNNVTAGFTVDAGIRIQGGNDRGGGDPKKSFRLFFSSEYGPSKLNYPLFGVGNPQQSFDHVLLKSIHNYSWANAGGTDPAQGDLVRDQFARDLQAAITGHSATTQWVQLYINGLYWGLYAATEEPDATWTAANFGGSKDDYDVIQPDGSGGVEVINGTSTAYQNLYTTITNYYSDSSISAAEYTSLQPQLDMKGLVDYMLNIFYRGDQDAPVLIGTTNSPRNFYAFRNAAINGPFEFTTWDGELGLGDVNFNRTSVTGNLSPGTLFQDLKTNPDFAQLVADETYRLFANNGILQSDSTVDNPKTRYDADANQINIAIVGESARWGHTQGVGPLTRDGYWIPEINQLNTNYFPQRSNIVLGQLKAISQFTMLGIVTPSFTINGIANRGGTVAKNAVLTLPDVNSTVTGDVIYYTLDGSDPRLSGGGLSSAAHVYSGAVAISATETVTVRILNGSIWSPIDRALYSVNLPAAIGNIAITEVNYHPADATPAELAINSAWTDNDFEFIELLNTSTQTVDLAGAAFDMGVTFTFGAVSVLPGQRVVIVSNPTAFPARYGSIPAIVGTYTGHLSNSSATIELKSAAPATVIANFVYVDSWYPRSDGNGSSLEVVSTTGNYNSSTNWRASYEVNGTPGLIGNPVTDVVINEIVSAPASGGQDAIELYNTTAVAINVGGWFISDSPNTLTKFTIPAGTMIAANGYLVFTASDFGNVSSQTAFGINGTSGDDLYLTKPKSATAAYAFADDAVFGTSAIGESFGRTPNGTGTLYPMAQTTLGSANSGPRIGPVSITEFIYNTNAGNANLQYIELQNQTNTTLNISNWQLINGVTFTFPAAAFLAPFEAVSVVHFNPATDSANLSAFLSAYGLLTSPRLIGPFSDKLSSKGEEFTLVRPDVPRADAPGYTPMILVDDLTFGITAPWPVTATGQAVVRLSNHTFGQDATNWSAQSPSIDYVPYGNAYFGGTTHYTYSAPTTLDSLTVGGTAVVTVGSGSAKALVVGGLSIASGATLDLMNHDLVDTSTNAAEFATVQQLAWSGTGLVSSTAAGNHLTHLAVMLNDNGSGQPLFGNGTAVGLFDGQNPSASAILVKYTYYGDDNLDGHVDGSDYSRIDNGYVQHLTGWFNGDFNNDGVINGSDYTLIDNAFNTQGAGLAASIAIPMAGVAFPASTMLSSDWVQEEIKRRRNTRILADN